MKTIIITGASSGIGKATALNAAQAGWHVTACGRNLERLAALAEQSPNISTLAFDLADRAACQHNLGDLQADVILLNAGTCEYVDTDNWEPELFERVFDANFFSVVNCLDALLPQMQAGNQLVFVDSLARLLPFTRSQAYGASKAALFYLAKCMDVDLKDRGIVVKTLSPGFVDTPLTGRNDFAMPMSITADQAAQEIMDRISRAGRTGYFPALFSACIRLLSSLPTALQVWLCGYMRRREEGTS